MLEVCACEGGAWDASDPDGWRMGDDEKLPLDGCLDNSKGMLTLPDTVGIPMRSENGWPNASQSFSTSAYMKNKTL